MPVLAKSGWLECDYWFYLNEEKEEYTTTLMGQVIKGNATFFPNYVILSVPLPVDLNRESVPQELNIRYDYSINRKTLFYQKRVMMRVITRLSVPYSDTGWIQQQGDHSLRSGTCKIPKNVKEGNRI